MKNELSRWHACDMVFRLRAELRSASEAESLAAYNVEREYIIGRDILGKAEIQRQAKVKLANTRIALATAERYARQLEQWPGWIPGELVTNNR